MQPEPFLCPECDRELEASAKKCSCGWKAAKAGTRKVAPEREVHAEVADILQQHRRKHRRWPRMMPTAMPDAVAWFINLLEPPDPKWERAREMTRRYGEGTFWEFPYIDRVAHCLTVYLALTPEFQHLVVAAREGGVYWRGDTDVQHFTRIIHETMQMHETGSEIYIPAAIGRMKRIAREGLLKRMPGSSEGAFDQSL